MILDIDTTDLNRVLFKLLETKSRKTIAEYSTHLEFNQADHTLKHLAKFLEKQGVSHPPKIEPVPHLMREWARGGVKSKHYSLFTIHSIVVHVKPGGSFSGIRVGLAIAQALSLAWGVPVRVVKK